MENTEITFEKRVKIVMGVFVVVALFLIYHLATSMSVLPDFLEANIARAPTIISIDPFIPEVHCGGFKAGNAIDQFDSCFDYFLKEGQLSPAYPPKKMYQPYTIKKLPDSVMKHGWFPRRMYSE